MTELLMALGEDLRLTADGASPIYVPRGREWLANEFARRGFLRGAEIGVWKGEYSEVLCLANPGLELRCVDPWRWYTGFPPPKRPKDLEAAYREAVERLAPYNCIIERNYSERAATQVPDGSLDFVYIDGNHAERYVLRDLKAWVPKVRVGGIVAGHDYYVPRHRNMRSRVKPAVDTYVHEHEIDLWWVLMADAKPTFMWMVT